MDISQHMVYDVWMSLGNTRRIMDHHGPMQDEVLMEECPYALSLLRFLRWCQQLVTGRSPEGGQGTGLKKCPVFAAVDLDLFLKNNRLQLSIAVL